MPKSVEGVLHEFKTGTLHSGSKTGPVVKSRKQAIAIALSEQQPTRITSEEAQKRIKKGKR